MRGQVDAPIELVVAVIILVMSLTLAFYVIDKSDEAKCMAELKSSTQHLQEAMQDIALGSQGTRKTISFAMPRCGNARIEGVRFVYYSDPNYCNLCPSNYGGCWQIVPITSNQGTYVPLTDAAVCVNLPGNRIAIQSKAGPVDGKPCELLNPNPCPPNAASCTVRESGVPSSIWNPSTASEILQKSAWNTLGRNAAVYRITLYKEVSMGGGIETGRIDICAQDVQKLRTS